MEIYSYFYGASAGNGIGIRAMSPQLGNLTLRSDLKDLASLHALGSAEHDGEMLSYLLQRDGFTILGLSYTESAKSSGYGRSAPCGQQYVLSDADMKSVSAELGMVVNFVSFPKPASASPAPLPMFPVNESGYYYHNSSAVLAPLVDGLVRAALSTRQEVLLVALPKGKSSEYATARYTIAEALNYLPVSLRQRIRFFTGLPVGDGVTDPLAGYDNAVKYNANVIFCPNEYFERLRGYRSFIGVNMERPDGRAGAFASYVSQTLTPAETLSRIACCLNGPFTYDSLNQAAQGAQRSEPITMKMLKSALEDSEKRCRQYELQANKQYQELVKLQNAYDELRVKQQPYYPWDIQMKPGVQQDKGILSRILLCVCVILLMGLTGFAAWIGATRVYTGHFFPPKETKSVTTDNTARSDMLPQESNASMQAGATDVIPAFVVTTPGSVGKQRPTVVATERNAPTETPPPAMDWKDLTGYGMQAVPTNTFAPEKTDRPETPGEAEATGTGEQEGAPPPDVILGVNNRYGVTNVRVNFREGNSKAASTIRELRKDTIVWMVQTGLNVSGEQWTEVWVNERHGYIMTQFLDIMTVEESNAYDAAQSSPVPERMYADAGR